MDDAFRRMADGLPTMLWRADAALACIFVNRRWLEFTGQSLAQSLGHGWRGALHPEDQPAVQRLWQSQLGQLEIRAEYRLMRHDGAWRWVLEQARPVLEDGQLAGFIGTCTDVTEMREALEERRITLDQRDSLQQELQHRVRNNAQATSSFLSLQAGRARDPLTAEALRAAAARVLLATQVQERLFRVPATAGVDLATELAAAARAAFALLGRPEIRLDLQLAEGFTVPVHRAAPLALIVTELVSNALRHAFPHDRPGEVRLLLDCRSPGQGLLLLADDGIGLVHPADGLGLHLVRRLAHQAGATFTLHGRGGTLARLEFADA